MADLPIPFTGPMVRALLAGTKTQTRRRLKISVREGGAVYDAAGRQEDYFEPEVIIGKPRYAVGDRLWVRETWKPGAWRQDGRVAIDYRASPEITNTPWCYPPLDDDFYDLEDKWTAELEAHGSVADEHGFHHWQAGQSPMRWRPGRYMPRWASRLTLTVTGVRVKRLQDISEEDAIAEGVCQFVEENDRIPWGNLTSHDRRGIVAATYGNAVKAYSHLWDEINGAGSWDRNPWVMVILFTVQKGNIDEVSHG